MNYCGLDVAMKSSYLYITDRKQCKLASHRGKKTAIVALARKLPAIAYRLLRDDTVYRSWLVCRPAA